MPLEATLADIGNKLREGRFPNERAISQGIVLRVLSEMGWNVYDTNIVWSEYSTGEGRVDFALCEPPAKPRVFVEQKAIVQAAAEVAGLQLGRDIIVEF